MRVSRIEIFGFKSFMERLVLPLECGVTGVVGPNGCGKSNIVDAIRWVLGETHARHLRGGTLEDVIFNGTDKLRPLGLAEVTITLRAAGASFFADLVSTELNSDQLESGAEEEAVQAPGAEAVSSEPSDVPVVEDVPSGRPKLTVIQGNLGAEEGSEPPPVQDAVPEVQVENAPDFVPPPRSMKSSTVAARMPTLSSRFAWLKSVSEVQVTRRLYRSGESEYFINRVPCRLKDLKDLFRAAGIGARAYTLVAQGEIARIVTAKPEDRRLIIEEAAGVLGFRDRIASTMRKIEETSVNISRLDDIIREVEHQVNILRRQAARARNRQELKDKISELDRKLSIDRLREFAEQSAAANARIAEIREQEGSHEAALQKLQAEEHALRNELINQDVQGDGLHSRMDALRQEVENRVRRQSDRRARLAELQAMSVSASAEIERLEERSSTLGARRKESDDRVASLQTEESELNSKIAGLESGDEKSLQETISHLSALRADLKIRERAAAKLREELAAARSSQKVIRQEILAASPLARLRSSDRDRLLPALQGQGLFEGLQIPEKYIKATQAVLAEKTGFLVVDKPFESARAFDKAMSGVSLENRPALGLLKAGTSGERRRHEQVPFPALLDEIKLSDDCAGAATQILSGVHVCESLERALDWLTGNQETVDSSVTLVTLDGDILTATSFCSLRHDGGLLQLKNKSDALLQTISRLEAEVEGAGKTVSELEQQIAVTEQEQQRLHRERQARQAEAGRLNNQMGNVRGRLVSEKRMAAQIDQDLANIARQVASSRGRLEEHAREREALQAELASQSGQEVEELKAQIETLNLEYREIEQVRRAGRERLSGMSAQVDQARAALDRLRSSVSSASLELQKISLERSNLQEKISGEYGTEVWQEICAVPEQAALSAEERKELFEECMRLKARIIREGDVDPESIPRFDEEKARLDNLQTQRSDLGDAAVTLKKTLERLTETSRERFLAVFEGVSRNFSTLGPRLFGGGKASIELQDPTKPLETGVEINIRPPGKKPKSIELLSGGEKALCATALIFSMFMERPSPLCVLDEVDAPLDEANLLRFLGMIREMSSHTQFLLITHNKQSMALADNLVGVTMPEPGASKIVTVSLQEALDQVA